MLSVLSDNLLDTIHQSFQIQTMYSSSLQGMACVGRTKQCTIVPSNHYGPIPGIPVGSLWKFRVQVRPHNCRDELMLLSKLLQHARCINNTTVLWLCSSGLQWGFNSSFFLGQWIWRPQATCSWYSWQEQWWCLLSGPGRRLWGWCGMLFVYFLYC